MSNSFSNPTTNSRMSSWEGKTSLQGLQAAPTSALEGLQSALCLLTVSLIWGHLSLSFSYQIFELWIPWPRVLLLVLLAWLRIDTSRLLTNSVKDLRKKAWTSTLTSSVWWIFPHYFCSDLILQCCLYRTVTLHQTHRYQLEVVPSRFLTQLLEHQVLFTNLIYTLFHRRVVSVSRSIEACS